MPSFREAMSDPDLVSKVSEALRVWSESKNLFIVLAILERLHGEHISAAQSQSEDAAEPEADAGEDEDEDGDAEEEDGDDEKTLASVGRYRDLFATYIGVPKFKEKLRARPSLIRWFVLWERITGKSQYYLFKMRRGVSSMKRTTDDAAFLIMRHILAKPADTPLKLALGLAAWVVLMVASVLLTLMIYILRPGKLLEFIGWDDEVLPLAE